MKKKRLRRPRLTRAVVEGLWHVSNEADFCVDERLKEDRPIGNEKAEIRGMAYIDALIEWYESHHK